MFKLLSIITGMLCALVVKRLMRTGYRAVRKDGAPDSPFDPTNARFSWPNTLLWAAAAGIGLGIAKVVSTRLAVIEWEAVTGTRPPGIVEEPAVV